MRKTVISSALSAAFALPGIAAAQAPAPGPVTANIGLFSDYRFRGLSQTFQRPALQGGFDYAHSSGFYIGNWNSNVSSSLYPNSNLEMDFYGGYKPTFGDITADIGFIYYYYPGSDAPGLSGGKIDNKEIYAGASWKWLSTKLYWSIDDFFSAPDTKNSWYLDFNANYDLGSGYGLVGHLGRQRVKNIEDADYTDWKLGITKDIRGFVFGAAYVDTNARDTVYRLADSRRTINIGKAGLVLSVSRTF